MTLHPRGVVLVGATMAVGALLSACGPDAPPTQSPTPVVTSTPSVSTPTESPEERQQREDYEAAEKAYRSFTAEYEREVRSSFRPHVTKLMRQTAAGPYLKAYAGFIRQRRKREIKSTGRYRIGAVTRVGFDPPSRVVIVACEDGTETSVVDRKGTRIAKGQRRTIELTIRRTGSTWKVFDGNNEKKVASCESS